MPTFMAIHSWKKEDANTIAKKVIEGMQKLPEGMQICFAYLKADQTGGWCVWQGESAEQIANTLREAAPEMKTDAVQILQWFPPSLDVYAIMHSMLT